MYGMVQETFSSTLYVFWKTIYETDNRCRDNGAGATATRVYGAIVTNSSGKSNIKMLVKFLMFGPNALKEF